MKKLNLPTVFAPLLAASVLMATPVVAKDLWPDLPVGMKSGVSAQMGDKLFVGLGSTGTDFYMLDLKNVKKGWQKRADFTGPARSGATASVVDGNIYVFGGSGKQQLSDASPILFDSVYRYNVSSDEWSMVETASPVGLLGAASYSPDNQQVVFFGGYNKAYFDKYLADINATSRKDQPNEWQKIVDDYMGMQPLDYNWNRHVVSYSPKSNEWAELGTAPYLPNCGSALLTQGSKATIISGEIKPGLRTAEVKQYQFGQPQPWESLHSLPAPRGSQIQEGIAGAFSGLSNGVAIVAGGANFHGAKAAFEQGNMFAHNGFGKAFNPEIYVYNDGLWSQSVNLPEGLAYGASFTTDQGVLIVGGEDSKRKARNDVYLLSWNGESVVIAN